MPLILIRRKNIILSNGSILIVICTVIISYLIPEKVAYVATGDAIRMANEIFGPNGWSSSVVSLQQDFVSLISISPA